MKSVILFDKSDYRLIVIFIVLLIVDAIAGTLVYKEASLRNKWNDLVEDKKSVIEVVVKKKHVAERTNYNDRKYSEYSIIGKEIGTNKLWDEVIDQRRWETVEEGETISLTVPLTSKDRDKIWPSGREPSSGTWWILLIWGIVGFIFCGMAENDDWWLSICILRGGILILSGILIAALA